MKKNMKKKVEVAERRLRHEKIAALLSTMCPLFLNLIWI